MKDPDRLKICTGSFIWLSHGIYIIAKYNVTVITVKGRSLASLPLTILCPLFDTFTLLDCAHTHVKHARARALINVIVTI